MHIHFALLLETVGSSKVSAKPAEKCGGQNRTEFLHGCLSDTLIFSGVEINDGYSFAHNSGN